MFTHRLTVYSRCTLWERSPVNCAVHTVGVLNGARTLYTLIAISGAGCALYTRLFAQVVHAWSTPQQYYVPISAKQLTAVHSVHFKCNNRHRWCRHRCPYVNNTCPISVKQFTAVHSAPGLHSVTQLMFTLHCHFCALFKCTVYHDCIVSACQYHIGDGTCPNDTSYITPVLNVSILVPCRWDILGLALQWYINKPHLPLVNSKLQFNCLRTWCGIVVEKKLYLGSWL